ncbi:MAG TPA: LPS assembly protein LptD [Candidatus Binataceae bacterium]|nr:LPS assembly protein LptD [Candidatus Binataceae bacterium]
MLGGSLAFAAGSARAQQPGVASYFQKTHGGPVDLSGQTFVYDYKTDSFMITGDAVVTQKKTVLTADQVDYQRRQHSVHAKGQVHLVDPLGDLHASEGTINLNEETATLTDATITNKDKSYRIAGSKIDKLEGQRYKVLNGFFTTCGSEPGTPDWSIAGDQMDLHMGKSGTARNSYFQVLGQPVLYFPYAVFPADTDRHSGLLSPRMGESGFRGFQYVQPWYWAINKSSDATAAFDLETKLRVGGLAEYRLITGVDDYFIADGAFYNEGLRSQSSRVNDVVDTQLADTHIPIDRYDIIGMARQHLTDDLVLYGDGLSVSDSLTLRELNVWTLSRSVQPGVVYPTNFNSMRDAISDFGALYSYNDGFARLQGTWNQDLIQSQDLALQTLPELLLSGRKQLLGGLAYADYDVQGDNFWRAQGQSGQRFDLSPRLTVPWRLSDFLYGYGQLGVRETLYSVSAGQVNVIPVGTGGQIWNNGLSLGPLAGNGGFHSREMIYGGGGLRSEIEKIYDVHAFGIDKIKHTIEPFATYSYIPQINQNQLPLYDEVDRMESRSLFTYGATSRFYAKMSPRDQANGSGDFVPLAGDDQQYNSAITDSSIGADGSSTVEIFRFTLMHAYDVNHAVAKGASRFSDLDMLARAHITDLISVGGDLGYSPQTSGIRQAGADLIFQPWWTRSAPNLYMGKAQTSSFLQVAYNYIAPGPNTTQPGQSANLSQFISARTYYELFDRMGLYWAPGYDIVKHKLQTAEYGLRIKAPCDCWAFDFGVTKTINPSETQYQFQLTLGGLGSVGQMPFGRNPFQTRVGVLPNYQ